MSNIVLYPKFCQASVPDSRDADDIIEVEDSDVWHEFTNQIGIVAAFSELLLEAAAEGRAREQLMEISRATDRVLALVPRLRAAK